MSRRRLWSATALTCVLLTLPGMVSRPGLSPVVVEAFLRPTAALAFAAIATGAALVALGTALVVRAGRARAPVVLALARRGAGVADIARRTRLAQDAVRDLTGGEPVAISTGRRGRIFRRQKTAPAAAADTFAAALEQSSFDTSA